METHKIKLVRSKMEEMCKESGRTVLTITSDLQRKELLLAKLYEEVHELIEAYREQSDDRFTEELIDVIDVVEAIYELSNCIDFERIRGVKHEERGNFIDSNIAILLHEDGSPLEGSGYEHLETLYDFNDTGVV